MRVIVTRPEPAASRTARRLRELGHEPVLAPLLLMRVEQVAPVAPAGFDAVAFTSAAAAEALSRQPWRTALLGLPSFAVGEATAQAARRLGFAHVVAAGGDAQALAERIAADLPGRGGRLLHLCGTHRAGDLAALLAPAGISVERRVLYRMEAVRALPATLAAAVREGRVDCVLLYSPRTAATYVELVARASADSLRVLPHLALSRAVAAPLAAAGFADVRVAAKPTEDALLAALAAPATGAPTIHRRD